MQKNDAFNKFYFSEINFLIFQNKILINKLLNLVIISSFQKSGNGQGVENLFPEKMIRDLLKSHHFLKFGMKRLEKSSGKNKFC